MQRTHTITMGIACVIILFTGAHYGGWLSGIDGIIRTAINATSSFMFKTASIGENIRIFFSHKTQLDHTIVALEAQVDDLRYDQAKLAVLEDENARLREQLIFFASTNTAHMGAITIGRTIDPIATAIIVDKGSRDGVKNGSPVIVGKGIFIGRVIQVHDRSSVVELIHDTQSRIAATVMNRDRSIGIIEGGFGISIRLKFIPQNEEIKPGDTIITSGLQEFIPRGLLIGTIEATEKKPEEPFQQAIIKPAHSLHDISMVSILLSE